MSISAEDLRQRAEIGSLVMLDIRTGRAYQDGHVRGSISAPFSRVGWSTAVRNWLQASGVSDVALLADSAVVAAAADEALRAVGVATTAVLDGGPDGWRALGLHVVSIPDLTADDLAVRLSDWDVIDVREPYEWRSGVIPGALTIPMNRLPEQVDRLDKTRRYAIVCASGSRSQQAAAFLADQGFEVANLRGGMGLWLGGRHPVEPPAGGSQW